MAAAVEMGEVDDIHSKEESKGDILVNGNIKEKHAKEDLTMETDDAKEVNDNIKDEEEESEVDTSAEVMEVDESTDSVTKNDSVSDEPSEKPSTPNKDPDEKQLNESVDISKPDKTKTPEESEIKEVSDDEVTEVHTIDSDDDDDAIDEVVEDGEEEEGRTNLPEKLDDTDDVMIVDDDIKENGTTSPNKDKDSDCAVIDADLPKPPEKSSKKEDPAPRRSSRRQTMQAKRVMSKEIISDESDIEEIMEEDPLAVPAAAKKARKSATIVVNDTKRLVEIASKTSPPNSGKKEPTLVIIDTNSILSGRGPVSVSSALKTTTSGASTTSSTFNVLPMALPAQGLYPANMRATITPIPMNTSTKAVPALTPVLSPSAVAAAAAAGTCILPSLTDDMFVVEAPSFIVPYVYEKPPIKDFREYIGELATALKKEREIEEKNGADDDSDVEEIKDDDSDVGKKDDEKIKPYFDSPIGKFFVDIGYNLVQEYVQTDLLKQQKRKRDREGGCNHETNKTIQSLIKTLEYTKENNEPYRTTLKKCEFCSYKSDSKLAMDFHLETPHMKNFVYRCNFCTYEVRSPHDILFHMEAEHCVRGRLERAPAFHQCPNCPFEDNQKGKLSRHSVACAKKFKPERNMEPPLDWEPPAKIPRQPRLKTPNLVMTAAMYQAMTKNTQAQFIKTHAVAAAATLAQQQAQQTAVNRGRGRPSLGGVSSGSSVLVPTNFQISGNQLYQVVGGQELGNRLGVFPTLSSTANSISVQSSSPKSKTVHQPSISITPLPRGSTSSSQHMQGGGLVKPGDSNSKNSFVICEICDGYIKDLEQLRNHMQWIHKVKIHPKMIYNRPPLNCQKCQFRFFTDQGLERHLLGSHGLVTSSMQEAANKCKDSGRCPVCGRVYQWKLLNHVARDHNMTLKPAHLSYKCTVCTATFGMYKQFENHVYSAHSVVAKRSIDKKSGGTTSSSAPTSSNAPTSSSSSISKGESLLKPLQINNEITIIPQMPKSNGAGSSKESSSSRSNLPGTSRSKLDKRESSLSGSAIDSGEIQIINLG
ncbi:MOG interacting and ectopic P-granules protein 1 isoform X2 [Atheta coriaria]|uniref:MOG interacting and ectopic P-granules protein 1 isoform X2 n=1 Tax=Dalotia coriaria TaxID=877792 RepID=UPI0031F3700F